MIAVSKSLKGTDESESKTIRKISLLNEKMTELRDLFVMNRKTYLYSSHCHSLSLTPITPDQHLLQTSSIIFTHFQASPILITLPVTISYSRVNFEDGSHLNQISPVKVHKANKSLTLISSGLLSISTFSKLLISALEVPQLASGALSICIVGNGLLLPASPQEVGAAALSII